MTSTPAPTSSLSASRLVDFGVLAIFGLYLALLLPEHEPWSDEAQSWLLARDASLWDLLAHRLRYEGTPALWTLLLMGPAKLGLPYESMQVLGAVAAFAGVALLVLKSPFPWWLRVLLPWSYFLGYQYAIVARNYCLLAVLLFATAVAARHRGTRYWPFALGVGLVSHVTLHAALFAIAIWLVETWRGLATWRREGWDAARSSLLPLAALALNFWVLFFQLLPPPDLMVRPPIQEWSVRLRILQLTSEEVFGAPFALGLLFLVLLLPLFWRRGYFWMAFLGCSFTCGLLAFRYFSVWHTGTIFVFVVFCLWLSFETPEPQGAQPQPHAHWPRTLALIGLTGMALYQVPGTISAARRDYFENYSSSREAAAYLRKSGIYRRHLNAFDFHSGAVLPYFEQNIFTNFRERSPASYWIWDRTSLRQMLTGDALRGRPEFALITAKRSGSYLPEEFLKGYVVHRVFQGLIIWRNRAVETDALILYRREDVPANPEP